MLDFEAALARAEAAVGVIPASAAPVIAAQCKAELYDIAALTLATADAGNPAIPLVKALTSLVVGQDPEAARYVHWGATSQDAMDTGLVLQLREALGLVAAGLARLSVALAALAGAHARTLLAGRTWLQQATPVTLGLKAAGILSAVERHRARIADLLPRMAVLQFGGATGTLASLGERGPAVAAALAQDLGLALPDVPWHTHRDRIAEVATTLGLVVGTLGKVARDVSLLMQTEVGEAFEPADARPRWILDAAAQAQSGKFGSGSGGGHARAGPGFHDARRDGAGTRTRLGRLARGMGDAARNLRADGGRARAHDPLHRRSGRRCGKHDRQP